MATILVPAINSTGKCLYMALPSHLLCSINRNVLKEDEEITAKNTVAAFIDIP